MIGADIPLLPKSFDAVSLNVMLFCELVGMTTDCFSC